MSEQKTILGKAGASALPAYSIVVPNGADPGVLDAASAATDVNFGVVQNAPDSGGEALVAIEGFTLVDTASDLDPYEEITSNGSGLAIAVTAGASNTALGYYCPEPVDGAVSSSTSGDRVRVYLYSYKGNIVP